VTLTGTTEGGARLDVVRNEAAPSAQTIASASGSFSVAVALLRDTLNVLEISATGHGGAGLVSRPVEVAITHDATPPGVTLESPAGGFVRGPVPIRASATDAGSDIASVTVVAGARPLPLALSPTPPAPAVAATAGWESAAEPDGLHVLTVSAADGAGNTSSLSRPVVVDNTPPETSIAIGPVSADSVTFVLGGTDSLTPPDKLAFAWRLDGGAWSPFSTTATTTVTELAPGSHRLEARARDLAGNEDPTPAVGAFTLAAPLRLAFLEPAPGAAVPAGVVLARGRLDGATGEVGITVNGTPAWLDGSVFAALVPTNAETTTLTATAVSSDGTTASASLPVVVTGELAPALLASPTAGVAPLEVRFSAIVEGGITRAELDADGDGVTDVAGDRLDDVPFVFTRPGVYVARATLTDTTGTRRPATAVVQIHDRAALDALLRAKWSAMKDALRRGDIAAGVLQIVGLRRTDYEDAFRLLAAHLPGIDAILTDIAMQEVRNAGAVYDMRRTDDGVLKSFEVRFRVDDDGIWRLEAF
jgi:hypothetical protein